jgi:hypothetical protein
LWLTASTIKLAAFRFATSPNLIAIQYREVAQMRFHLDLDLVYDDRGAPNFNSLNHHHL